MSTAKLALAAEIDALRGDLRPCEQAPRPIPRPENSRSTQIGGRR